MATFQNADAFTLAALQFRKVAQTNRTYFLFLQGLVFGCLMLWHGWCGWFCSVVVLKKTYNLYWIVGRCLTFHRQFVCVGQWYQDVELLAVEFRLNIVCEWDISSLMQRQSLRQPMTASLEVFRSLWFPVPHAVPMTLLSSRSWSNKLSSFLLCSADKTKRFVVPVCCEHPVYLVTSTFVCCGTPVPDHVIDRHYYLIIITIWFQRFFC